MRFIGALVLLTTAAATADAQSGGLAQQVRLKLSAGDFESAEAMVDEAQRAKGITMKRLKGSRGLRAVLFT